MKATAHSKEFGIMSAFISPSKRKVYRRVNVENLLIQNKASLQKTQAVLIQGLRANLEMQARQTQVLQKNHESSDFRMRQVKRGLKVLGSTMVEKVDEVNGKLEEIHRDVKKDVGELARGINQQVVMMAKSHRVLEDLLSTVQSPRASEAMELARLAARNVQESSSMNEMRARRLLTEGIDLLKKSLSIYQHDYKAHFDFAWLSGFVLGDNEKAEQHYDQAVLRSLNHDESFAIYALRHLAETRRELKKYKGAVEAAKEAYQMDSGKNPQIQFDLSRYLALVGENQRACIILRNLLSSYPSFFLQAIAEVDFIGNKEIEACLEQIFNAKFEHCMESIRSAWAQLVRKSTYLKGLEHDVLGPVLEQMEELRALALEELEPTTQKIKESLLASAKQVHQLYSGIESSIREEAMYFVRQCEKADSMLTRKEKRKVQDKIRSLQETHLNGLHTLRLDDVGGYLAECTEAYEKQAKGFLERHKVVRFFKKKR